MIKRQKKVTILILIDGFLQLLGAYILMMIKIVTILILIDGFLQYCKDEKDLRTVVCHNPYFNRWFSAINVDGNKNGNKQMSQSLF